jgi:glycosyltransferase involved in cell wall biosynthesis
MIVHNSFPKFEWSSWHRKHYQESFASVRGVYAVSQSALDHFVELYGDFIRAKTVLETIHNSVDTARFLPDARKRRQIRERYGIPMDAPLVGFVGRIEKQKRPFNVVGTFARLIEKIPTAHLLMVGSGPLETSVSQRVRDQGLKERTHFAGWRNDVENFFPAFDLVLQLSSIEGFGTSTAEAMACGIPVVGTDVPGTRDILAGARGGILIPPGDEKAAAEACVKILKNYDLQRRMGEDARNEVMRHYTETAWEGKIMSFYERAIPEFHAGENTSPQSPEPVHFHGNA